MASLRCPTCNTLINLSMDIPPGRTATVTCSHCKQAFKANSEGVIRPAAALPAATVPAAIPLPFNFGVRPALAVPLPQAAVPAPAGDPLSSDDAVSKSGVRSKVQRPEKTEPKPRGRVDEDSDHVAPTDPPNRAKRTLLIATVGGVVSLALGLGVGLLVLGGSKGNATGVKPQSRGGDIARNAPARKPANKTDKPQPDPEKKDKPEKPEAEPVGAVLDRQDLAGDAVYDRMIRGCVFIVAFDRRNNMSTGTGWVADTERKIVVTAHHVIEDAESIYVFLPQFDRAGRPITSVDEYLGPKVNGKREKKGIPASLIKPEDGRTKDLALLQVEGELPPKTRPIPLAATDTKAGQQVYSVGSSGAIGSGILWRFLPGTVSTDPVLKKYLKYDAYICEIKSQNNPGDSGGPIVNSKVEIVGLVSAGSKVENSIITAVDVREIRAVLKSAYDRKGWEWKDQRGAVAGGAAGPKSSAHGWVRQLKAAKRPDDIKDAARRLGELEEDAQVAVPDLLDVLLKNPDPQVQEIVFAALEAIKKPAKLDRSLIAQALKSTHILAQTYAVGLLRIEKANRDEYIEVLELAKQAHQKILDGKTETTRELAADRELLARTFGVFQAYGLDCKEDVIDLLFTALEDTDPGVRQAAGNTVDSYIEKTKARDPKGSPFDKAKDTPRLKAALENSKNPNLRRVAAYAYRVMPDSANEAFAFYTVRLLSDEKDPNVLVRMVDGLTERWSKDRGIERYREAVNKLSDHGDDKVKEAFIKAAGLLPWHKTTNDRLIALLTSSETEQDIKKAAFNVLVLKLDIPTGKKDAERELADEQLQLIIALLSSKEREKQMDDLRTKSEQQQLNDKEWKNFKEAYSRRNLETKQLVDKLAKFGPSAGSATAELVALFKARNSYKVRIAVLKTLRSIGKDAAKHATDAVLELLTPKDSVKTLNYERIEEAYELHLHRLADKGPSTFEQALKETHDEYRLILGLEAVATLATFGEAAMEGLVAALRNKNLSDVILGRVCLALVEIGAPAQDKAIPSLLTLAENTFADMKPDLRNSVFKAVTKLGGDELVQWLLNQNLTNKTKTEVQAWAYEVMGELDLRTVKNKELLAKMEGRLRASSERHPDPRCKQAAKEALRQYQKAMESLKKTSTLEGKDKK